MGCVVSLWETCHGRPLTEEDVSRLTDVPMHCLDEGEEGQPSLAQPVMDDAEQPFNQTGEVQLSSAQTVVNYAQQTPAVIRECTSEAAMRAARPVVLVPVSPVSVAGQVVTRSRQTQCPAAADPDPNRPHFITTAGQPSTQRRGFFHAPTWAGRAWKRGVRKVPRPDWLPSGRNQINIAICGQSHAGKSTFINTMLGRGPRDPGALRTHAHKECTLKPKPVSYHWEGTSLIVNFFDLPGGGTINFRAKNYFDEMGLPHFDVILCMCSGKLSETLERVVRDLHEEEIPHFIVFNRADLALRKELQEKEWEREKVLTATEEHNTKMEFYRKVKSEFLGSFEWLPTNKRQPYVISSLLQHAGDWDFPDLLSDLMEAVKRARNVQQK